MPFKAVGSGAPAFGRPCLRKDDKAVDVGMPDLSLLSPSTIKSAPAAASTADESRHQVVGFAQAAVRAAAMAPSGPALSLQPQPQRTTAQQQLQHARKSRQPVLVAGVAPPVRRCLESTRWPPSCYPKANEGADEGGWSDKR